jgi:hypothetical protein
MRAGRTRPLVLDGVRVTAPSVLSGAALAEQTIARHNALMEVEPWRREWEPTEVALARHVVALTEALRETLDYMAKVRGGAQLHSEEYYVVSEFAQRALAAVEATPAGEQAGTE